MSSPYLNVILTNVRALEGEQRLYYERVVTSIDSVKAFENKQNIAFMVLADCLEDLPELLPANMPEKTFLSHIAKYLHDQRDYISKTVYSKKYILNPQQVARELGEGFTARIATDLLEQYAAGTLETGEAKSYSFRWPYTDTEEFPYEEIPDPAEDDGTEVTLQIVDGEFKIIDPKK